MIAICVAAPVLVPILRDLKQVIEMHIAHDTKRIEHAVLDCLDNSLDAGLQVR